VGGDLQQARADEQGQIQSALQEDARVRDSRIEHQLPQEQLNQCYQVRAGGLLAGEQVSKRRQEKGGHGQQAGCENTTSDRRRPRVLRVAPQRAADHPGGLSAGGHHGEHSDHYDRQPKQPDLTRLERSRRRDR
jgi:hypothetical protein